ncbi:MAG: PH domain-containing protein [Candidatus Saccharibacteria bacterium]
MDKQDEPIDYSRPVAYDINGQPLYAHPPIIENYQDLKNKENNMSSDEPVISDATRLKHIKSQKIFPELVLNDGDFVVSSVKRHLIGLAVPFAAGVLSISLAFTVLFNYDIIINALKITGPAASLSNVFIPVIAFVIFVIFSEYIVYYIFTNNKFFLTNDSVVQQVQTGLFSNSEHIVSLGNIEDASYSQNGIIQQFFNYGSIRLSTEGDETTYRFTYVSNPKECISTLDNAIENFKNFRRPC